MSLHAIIAAHTPMETMRTSYEPGGILCRCDGVWRAPSIYASHVAGAVLDAGYEPADSHSTDSHEGEK